MHTMVIQQMKYYLTISALLLHTMLLAQRTSPPEISPLASYSEEWNKPEYAQCNTARNVSFMSKEEKNVIYILNLARSYPQLFAGTVLEKYPDSSGNEELRNDTVYFRSLLIEMQQMKPAPLLVPDNKCWTSAQCHAYQSGLTGYAGHERTNKECQKKEYYSGECCDYGNSDPLGIVLSLLIDDGVPSLGHRQICLGSYTKLGVSIQPHKEWKFNAVLDFQD
jgi:uncharacterized protein YkwD